MHSLPPQIENHSAFLLANQVETICHPLKQHFDVTLFYYLQSYFNGPDKGKRLLLSSNAAWVKDYFQLKHYEYELANYPQLFKDKKFVASIWDGCASHHDSCKIALLSQSKYNISHFLYLTWVYENDMEVFCFGIPKGHDHVPQQLLFNLDTFQRFCHYFNDVGHELILNADKDAFKVPLYEHKNYSNPHYLHLDVTQNKSINQTLPLERIFLKDKLKSIFLTVEEAKTIALACQAIHYAEIAQILGVTEPTIKYRMSSMRKKCGVKNKQALIRLFIDEDYITLIKQALG